MAFSQTPIYLIPNGTPIGWSDTPIERAAAGQVELRRTLITGGTITSNLPALSITQTWNSGAVEFDGIQLNVTNTASATASRLLKLQTNGSTMLYVKKDGHISIGADKVMSSSSGLSVIDGDFIFGGAGAGALNWGDLYLRRGSANVLAQHNSTNAQSYHLYNTYTSGSNYERAELSWGSNVFSVATTTTGGTRRTLKLSGNSLLLYTGSSETLHWALDANGHWVPSSTDSYNVGSSSFSLGRLYSNRVSGLVSDAGAPTTSHFTTNKDWGIYKNTTSGAVSVVFNDGGVIKTLSNASPLELQSTGIWLYNDSSFSRLNFGGNTSSFPSLKRSGTSLIVQLADDSGVAPLVSGALVSSSVTTSTVSASDVLLGSSGAVRIGGTSGTGFLAFSNSSVPTGTLDLYLLRDAANIFGQRNSTFAQGYHLYNTYTSGSNYERGELKWVSNVLRLHTTTTGGTVRNLSLGGSSLDLQTGTTLQSRFVINSSGHIIPQSHESYDLGSAAANMRQVFSAKFGGVIAAAGSPTTGTYTTNEDWGFYKNTSTGDVSIAYNDGGVILEWDPGGGPGTSVLVDQGSGVWLFDDATFVRLNFGDNLDESPALKKSGTDVHFVLADNSLYTHMNVGTIGLVSDGTTSENPYIQLAGYSGPVELLNLDILRVYNVGANAAGIEVIQDGSDLVNYNAGGCRWNSNAFEFNTWAAGSETRLAPNFGLFHRSGEEDGSNMRDDTFGVFLDTSDESVSLVVKDSLNGTESLIVPLTKLSSAYIIANVSTDRSYNADSTSINELADVLGTLIADLQAVKVIP